MSTVAIEDLLDRRVEPDALESMRLVGSYRLGPKLGHGGMAVVHAAFHVRLRRWDAVKQMLEPADPRSKEARLFLQESRIAGSLSHPNIVPVYDVFSVDGADFIAMELMRGGSLRAYVSALTLGETAGVLQGVFSALSAVERAGIVHRDLKPENVMVTAEGGVKIADFGIARPGDDQTSSLQSLNGGGKGTPHYMSPEQALGEPEIDHRADLYAVGCMAYEMLAGRRPFAHVSTPIAIVNQQCYTYPPPVHEVAPYVDRRLSDWVDWLLRKDPGERPQSAREAWESLEEIIVDVEGPGWQRRSSLSTLVEDPDEAETEDPPGFDDHTTDPVKRRSLKGVTVAVGAAVASAVAVVAVLLAQGDGGTPTATPTPTAAVTAAQRLVAGKLSVALPAGWAPLPLAPAVAGLTLDRDAAAGDERGFAAIVGMAPKSAANPALLPAELLDGLSSEPTASTKTLGPDGIEALRYDDLRPKGFAGAVTLYAVPLDKGVATVACATSASALDDGEREACAEIAASLEVGTAKPFPVGPDDALASTLARQLGNVAGVHSAGPFRRSRSALNKLRPSPADAALLTTLTRALGGTAAGFDALEEAIDGRSATGYKVASRRIRTERTKLRDAVSAFRAAGYAGLSTPRSGTLPPLPTPTPSATPIATDTTESTTSGPTTTQKQSSGNTGNGSQPSSEVGPKPTAIAEDPEIG